MDISGMESKSNVKMSYVSAPATSKKRKAAAEAGSEMIRKPRIANDEQIRSHSQLNRHFDKLYEALKKSGIVLANPTKTSILEATMQYLQLTKQSMIETDRETEGIDTDNSSCVDDIEDAPESTQDPTSSTAPTDLDAVFRGTPIPMALASLDGSILECNSAFTDFSQIPQDTLRSLTIFNVIAKSDLTLAFERTRRMLVENLSVTMLHPDLQPFTVQGALAHRRDFEVSIGIFLGQENNRQGFHITLLSRSNPSPRSPVPVVVDANGMNKVVVD